MDAQESKTVDILMQKYSLLKQEVWMYAKNYENQVTYLQFGVAALFGALAYLFNQNLSALTKNIGLPFSALIAGLAYLITTAAFLLIFKVLENNYRVVVLASRMSIIEEAINAKLGDRILSWERLLVEPFSTISGSVENKKPKPRYVNLLRLATRRNGCVITNLSACQSLEPG